MAKEESVVTHTSPDDTTPAEQGADRQTMVRTTLVVGDRDYLLAQSEDSNGLRERIETALHAGGGFVDFVVLGNRRSSVLITAHSQVAMHVETVAFDARDTGDEETPFGGFYDIGIELL